jgi:hypothetical protein
MAIGYGSGVVVARWRALAQVQADMLVPYRVTRYGTRPPRRWYEDRQRWITVPVGEPYRVEVEITSGSPSGWVADVSREDGRLTIEEQIPVGALVMRTVITDDEGRTLMGIGDLPMGAPNMLDRGHVYSVTLHPRLGNVTGA